MEINFGKKTKYLWALLLIWVGIVILSVEAYAVPAMPYPQTVQDKATGQRFQLKLNGDEFFNYITDLEGRLVVADNDNVYRYVVEQEGAFVLDAPVAQAQGDYSLLSITPWITTEDVAAEDFQTKINRLRQTLAADAVRPLSTDRQELPTDYQFSKNKNDPLYGKTALDHGPARLQDKVPDTIPLLIVQIQYNNMKATYSDEAWHNRFFGNGTNSVADYYKEVSNNQFTYVPAKETYAPTDKDFLSDGTTLNKGAVNDGVITITMPMDALFYTSVIGGTQLENGVITGLYTGTDGKQYAINGSSSLFAYVLDKADPYINYASYDKNGDGFVAPSELAFQLVSVGVDMSAELSPEENPVGVWPHSHRFYRFFYDGSQQEWYADDLSVVLDGKKMYKFVVIAESSMTVDLETGFSHGQAAIGVACHELGHDLGLMDLYNTKKSSTRIGVGYLSLMASGSWASLWGEQPGSNPTHLDAFSKSLLGFYTPTTVTAAKSFQLHQAASPDKYNILRINTSNPEVYYLVENRTMQGFDRGLSLEYAPVTIADSDAAQPNGGVVVWRINEAVIKENWEYNAVNTDPNNMGVMPQLSAYSLNDKAGKLIPFLNFSTVNREYISRDAREAPEFWPYIPLEVGANAVTEVSMLQQYDACDFLEFFINGAAASVDAENATILLPTNTAIGEATPQFTLSTGAVVEKELRILPPSSTSGDFSSAVTFRIRGADGYTFKDWTVAATSMTATKNAEDGSTNIALQIPLPRPHQFKVLRTAFDDATKTLTDVYFQSVTVRDNLAQVPAPAATGYTSYKLYGVDKNNLPFLKLAETT